MVQKILDKIHTPNWLVFLLGVGLILRVPSLLEPYSYGDEMIYLALGQAIRRGLVLYRDIHDNKPPLLYFIAAISGNLFWLRAILAGWMMITTIIFWKLTRALFPKNILFQKISTIAFLVLTTLPLLEGQIANAELFMIGPTILAFTILITKKNTVSNLLFTGFLFSISALFKIPAAFDILAIFCFWIITARPKFTSYLKIIQKMALISTGFLIPIAISLVWYYYRGGFREYFTAAFLQNVGYLSSFRPDNVTDPFFVRNAPLIGRGVIVLLGVAILFIFRKSLSKPYILASSWILFGLFAITLSERPYPHYLIQIVPPLAIFIGLLATSKNKEQSLSLIPLSLVLLPVLYYNFWYYPTGKYYLRFLEFASGKIDKQEYFNRFEGNTNRNYLISEMIKSITKKTDKVFVWGNSSVIYALSGRLPPIKYVADYHIKDFSASLQMDMPKIIILLPESEHFEGLVRLLHNSYRLIKVDDGTAVWSKITNNANN